MAVYVNTNVSSLNGRRYLNNVQNQLTTTYQRLSSGLRINSAKDDAAGLQISSRLTTQINGLNQGNRNASDGVAFAQTAEGAMDEITGMLQKIRTLAVQARNGTNTLDDRNALAKEASALAQEVTRIAQQTKFAGGQILDGAAGLLTKGGGGGAAGQTKEYIGKLTLQVGANKGDSIDFEIYGMKFSQIASQAGLNKANDLEKFWKAGKAAQGQGQATPPSITFSKLEDVDTAIASLDKMIGAVDATRAGLGAIQNHGRAR